MRVSAAASRAAIAAAAWLTGTPRDTAVPIGTAPPADCRVVALDSATAATRGLVPPPMPREFRAAWITPVDGGEWPSRPGMSDAQQQAELTALLDRAAALKLNAVILHVRAAADAMYPTARAPWSSYLTRGGAAPGYDPLAFAVTEAHRRGLQLHAWVNPFRAAPPDGRDPIGARRIRAEHPEWLVRYGSQQWIDPGDPAARQDVLASLLEIVDRYDVDAIHLDDYFYPYREERTVVARVKRGRRTRRVAHTETIGFDDARSWARYGTSAGWSDRGAWRRNNISDFVDQLYRRVKARKPGVLVGLSPFGIWHPGFPRGITGLDADHEIYADSRRWWREGWLDYLAPQLYWPVNGEQSRFTRLDGWWREENALGRHLWPGMLTMRATEGRSPWPIDEIAREIATLRSARAGTTESQGHVHFRMRSLLASATGSLGDRLAATTYAESAIVPPSPWLGGAAPPAPQVVGCIDAPSTGVVTVATTGGAGPRWWLVRWRDAAGAWSSRLQPADAPAIATRLPNGRDATAIAVSAIAASGTVGPVTIVAPSAP